MAAPKGNQFWKLRSKHGRDKLFSSPELLWAAACEYFEWCDEHPLLEQTIQKIKVNGEGEKIVREDLPKMRAYTMQGLFLYLDCNIGYFSDFENSIKNSEYADSKGFSEVITRIRDVIYTQKFEGAAAGFLNPNIIARDLGLKDKSDITTNDEAIKPPSINISVVSSDDVRLAKSEDDVC